MRDVRAAAIVITDMAEMLALWCVKTQLDR